MIKQKETAIAIAVIGSFLPPASVVLAATRDEEQVLVTGQQSLNSARSYTTAQHKTANVQTFSGVD